MNNDKENKTKDTFAALAVKQPPPGLSFAEYSDWLWQEGWRRSLVIDADTFACQHPDEEGALVHAYPVGVLESKWKNGEVEDNDRVIVVFAEDRGNGGEERWFALSFAAEYALYCHTAAEVLIQACEAAGEGLSILYAKEEPEEPAEPEEIEWVRCTMGAGYLTSGGCFKVRARPLRRRSYDVIAIPIGKLRDVEHPLAEFDLRVTRTPVGPHFRHYVRLAPDVRPEILDLSILYSKEEPAGPFSGDRPDALALDMVVDMVNRPPHYTRGKHEAIDVIEDKLANTQLDTDEGYLLGQALKYLLRYGLKGDKGEQVAKSRWYLDRLTAKLKVWEGGGR